MIYRWLVRPPLFRMDPEDAHDRALFWASRFPGLARLWAPQNHPELEQELFGRCYQHPVGLAAGLDKNGVAVPFWSRLGMSHVEVGGVTPLAREGNEKPRVWRFPSSDALANRMGLNGPGAEVVARTLKSHPYDDSVALGVNVASADFSTDDFISVIRTFNAIRPVDFFTVNISCPNVGARPDIEALDAMLRDVRYWAGTTPLFVKLAPNLVPTDLFATTQIAKEYADALVLTNTESSTMAGMTAGLSGAPITKLAEDVTRQAYRFTEGRLPIIGVGGIMNADDAYRRIRCGASLLQLCTGLVYRGPGLVKEIVDGLAQRLRDADTTLEQAIGADA